MGKLSSSGNDSIKLDGKIVKEFGDGKGLIDVNINKKLAYSIFEASSQHPEDQGGPEENGLVVLHNFYGTWTDSTGRKIDGFLTYTPN